MTLAPADLARAAVWGGDAAIYFDIAGQMLLMDTLMEHDDLPEHGMLS